MSFLSGCAGERSLEPTELSFSQVEYERPDGQAVLDLIEQELDSVFDEGEDRVKETLMQEPMASVILADFHKKNVLMVRQKLQEDHIEQMYVTAFRQYDRLKEGLEERILALSPLKAYHRGEVIWRRIRQEQNMLLGRNCSELIIPA